MRLEGFFIDAANTTIPPDFDNSAGSRLGTSIRQTDTKPISGLTLINTTANLLAVTTVSSGGGIPARTSKRAFCPPNYSVTFTASQGETLVLDNIYIQNERGAAPTSGLIIVNMWG